MTNLPPGEMEFRKQVQGRPNMLVPWFLMASYLYYIRDESLLLDATFDQICVWLRERWATIEHPHKHLISLAHLKAGTGYNLREDEYPGIVKSAACTLMGWGVRAA